jgi:hypothetical protein
MFVLHWQAPAITSVYPFLRSSGKEWGRELRKIEEYLRHAKECRQLAWVSNGEYRRQLLDMAETWEGLAQDREEQIARHERIAEMERGVSAYS